jgi:orotidine-5'-phosphate decarboxylase
MDAKDRIIFPLDVPSIDEAVPLVDQLFDYVGSFKFGLELINSLIKDLLVLPVPEAYNVLGQARTLFSSIGPKLFWDGKLCDIPATILGVATATSGLRVRMFDVHCLGGEKMMQSARQAAEEYAREHSVQRPLVYGVTLLTSLTWDDLQKLGFRSSVDRVLFSDAAGVERASKAEVQGLVGRLAQLAETAGLDGVIASPQEIAIVKHMAPKLRIVTPGVRPAGSSTDDQVRVMTPGEAIRAGADELVIGRPIRKPPEEIGSPVEAAKRIADEIEAALQAQEAQRRG